MQQITKSPGPTLTWLGSTPHRGLSKSKVNRCRYLLQGPNGFFAEEFGAITETSDPQEATAFVDVVAAAERGQALIANGYPVQRVTPVVLT